MVFTLSKNQWKVTGYQWPRCHLKIQWNPTGNSVKFHWKPVKINWKPVKLYWMTSAMALKFPVAPGSLELAKRVDRPAPPASVIPVGPHVFSKALRALVFSSVFPPRVGCYPFQPSLIMRDNLHIILCKGTRMERINVMLQSSLKRFQFFKVLGNDVYLVKGMRRILLQGSTEKN